MAVSVTQSSASIGTSEYFLKSASTTATYQTTDTQIGCIINFKNMAAGDEYQVAVYEKSDGTNAEAFYKFNVVGAQSPTAVALPNFILGVGWEIGVKKIAGTDRTIYWVLAEVTA